MFMTLCVGKATHTNAWLRLGSRATTGKILSAVITSTAVLLRVRGFVRSLEVC
jgi:hypothetical protein